MEQLQNALQGKKKYFVIGGVVLVALFLYFKSKGSTSSPNQYPPMGNGGYTGGGNGANGSPTLSDTIAAQLGLAKGESDIEYNDYERYGNKGLEFLARNNDETIRSQSQLFSASLNAAKQTYDEQLRQQTSQFDFLYTPTTPALIGRTPVRNSPTQTTTTTKTTTTTNTNNRNMSILNSMRR